MEQVLNLRFEKVGLSTLKCCARTDSYSLGPTPQNVHWMLFCAWVLARPGTSHARIPPAFILWLAGSDFEDPPALYQHVPRSEGPSGAVGCGCTEGVRRVLGSSGVVWSRRLQTEALSKCFQFVQSLFVYFGMDH